MLTYVPREEAIGRQAGLAGSCSNADARYSLGTDSGGAGDFSPCEQRYVRGLEFLGAAAENVYANLTTIGPALQAQIESVQWLAPLERVIARGQNLLAGATGVDLGPFRRLPDETVDFEMFIIDDVATAEWAPAAPIDADELYWRFRRTATVGGREFVVNVTNNNAATARTFDWKVTGKRFR
jgi:hypothetical protein